tara:strand:+ start:105 stop:308 length:204 start_codon:yes stop_codon:yes gene_type:complete
MNEFNTYWIISGLIIFLLIVYIIKQIRLEKEIALKDTTLESLEEKLKKHKLVGGRHKRTNKKNPPIV